MTRIAFIITGLGTGGAEMMLLKVLTHLDRSRFEPHVIALAPLGDMAQRIAALNVPVQSINMRRSVLALWHIGRLIRMLKVLRPDVVHTWMYHADLVGGLAARMAGVRAVGWCIRNSDLGPQTTSRSTRMVVWLCARLSRWLPTRILCCSEAATTIHVQLGYAAHKMQVIPNGFDLTLFRPDVVARLELRNTLVIRTESPVIGLIGRYHPQKNHYGFIDAAAIVIASRPETQFVMAGTGVETTNTILLEKIKAAGLEHHMHMLGNWANVPALMNVLDVLVSASTYGEAFPNVLGEAMACGVPVVTTDVGDSAYIVGDTGLVVTDNTPAQLAAGIQRMLELAPSARAALGARARDRVLTHFDIHGVTRQYEQFYEDILATASAANVTTESR
ncbi:glycosyltransferase [Hydrogenophaga sp. OTU3427]|uniref:glycosyltransferase n=1 Tax=Hydrogenophaga sp. OTU3427 TaxID=3043856 RepID=UPI00313A9B2D